MTTRRSRLAAFGLLFGAFAVGALAGGIGVSVAEHRGFGPGKHRGGREGYVERLTQQLDLNAAQRDSILAILERSEPYMDSLWREVRPRFDSARKAVRSAIEAQLSPTQLQRYHELLERRDREYRARRGNDRKAEGK